MLSREKRARKLQPKKIAPTVDWANIPKGYFHPEPYQPLGEADMPLIGEFLAQLCKHFGYDPPQHNPSLPQPATGGYMPRFCLQCMKLHKPDPTKFKRSITSHLCGDCHRSKKALDIKPYLDAIAHLNTNPHLLQGIPAAEAIDIALAHKGGLRWLLIKLTDILADPKTRQHVIAQLVATWAFIASDMNNNPQLAHVRGLIPIQPPKPFLKRQQHVQPTYNKDDFDNTPDWVKQINKNILGIDVDVIAKKHGIRIGNTYKQKKKRNT